MIRFDSMDRPIEGGKFSNATFGRIKPIVLGFDPLSLLIRTNPRTIGLIRLKVAGSIFHIFRPIRHSENHEKKIQNVSVSVYRPFCGTQ